MISYEKGVIRSHQISIGIIKIHKRTIIGIDEMELSMPAISCVRSKLRITRVGCDAQAAYARALAHGSPFYRTVKTILVGGHDLRGSESVTLAAATHSGRFARDAASLFAAPESIH